MNKNHRVEIVKGDEMGKRGLLFCRARTILRSRQRNVAKNFFSIFGNVSKIFPKIIEKTKGKTY